jgi:N-acyl-D-amino-acid deacylase
MIDLLIKDGLIIDGTGSPGFHATVGIKGDTISILRGDVSDIESKQVIDATGKIVCPGFIDVHAHSALMILHEPQHLPKVHQGVTTELIGVDGNSYAPFTTQQDLKDFIVLNAGLDGAPPITPSWLTVSEYLDEYDKKVSVNIAYVVGNSPIRISAMGWGNRKPTTLESDRMRGLLRESMEEGAVGISTGLDYPPGSYADTDELVDLSKEVAKLGGIYHTHVRYALGDRFLDPYREAIEIGRRSGIPVHLTHMLPKAAFPGSSMRLIELVDQANLDNLDVTFDCFPYTHGGTRLLFFLPQWTHDGGLATIYDVLQSKECRARLHEEISLGYRESWDDVWLTYFKYERNKKYEGWSIAKLAAMTDKTVVNAVCDLLLDDDLQPCFHSSGPDPMVLPTFFAHPNLMVGSDGILVGDYPPASSHGTFPLVISKYCRDDERMSLPDVIRKMTSYPAHRLGLTGRGLLRDGMKADVVIFDFENINSHATRLNPRRFSSGIEYVIVNGEVVVDHGEHTGFLPGRALKRGFC